MKASLIAFFKHPLVIGIIIAIIPSFIVISGWINRPKIEFFALEYNINKDFLKALPEEAVQRLPSFLIDEFTKIEGFKINIKNSGNASAKNISFNLLFKDCEVKHSSISKTNADCIVKVMPSTNLKLMFPNAVFIDADPSIALPKNALYINIPELRKKSEVVFNFSLYGKPDIKIRNLLIDNCKPRVYIKSVN